MTPLSPENSFPCSQPTSAAAGNVFYEILFSVTGAYPALNFCYFFFGTVTMVCGAAVVAVSTTVSVFVNELNGDVRRGTLVTRLRYLRIIVFQLYNSSQFAWMTALLFMGYVKYERHWRMSMSTGGCVLVLMTVAWLRIRALWSREYHEASDTVEWVDNLFQPLQWPTTLAAAVRLAVFVLFFGGLVVGVALIIALA